jgi:hypothetical protein
MQKSKPNIRQEQFNELKEQIEFWNKRIDVEKEMLADSKRAKTRAVRELLRLQKRYIAQNGSIIQ